MFLPVIRGMASPAQGANCHMPGGASANAPAAATLVHGARYFIVTAAATSAVFAQISLGMLRKAWLDLDLIWAGALIATGALTASV